MKWKIMTKQETGGCEIAFVDAGDEINRVVEISCRKNNYKVRLYKNDGLLTSQAPKTFKTLAAAKRSGEKWVRGQVDLLMKDLTRFLESK